MITHQQPTKGLGPDKVVIMAVTALANFARHMTVLRKRRGLSQPKLADAVGTAANVIGRYERGEATPSIETARKIADALGSSLDYMTSENMASDPEKEKAFGERCRIAAALPDDDQKRIIELMDILIRDARARTAYG